MSFTAGTCPQDSRALELCIPHTHVYSGSAPTQPPSPLGTALQAPPEALAGDLDISLASPAPCALTATPTQRPGWLL